MIQKHFVVDTETLGVKENAVVLSMAVVFFTFEEKTSIQKLKQDSYYCKFNVEEQIKLKRDVDTITLEFWSKQDPATIKMSVEPSKEDVSLQVGLEGFAQFLKKYDYDWKTSFLWSRGIGFDFPKLESLCECIGFKIPFNMWKARDIRTFIDCFTGSIDGQYELQENYANRNTLIKHHALSDCILDTLVLKEIFQKNFEKPE